MEAGKDLSNEHRLVVPFKLRQVLQKAGRIIYALPANALRSNDHRHNGQCKCKLKQREAGRRINVPG